MVTNLLLLFAQGQQHLLDLVLIEVDMRVKCYVFYDIALHLQRIQGLALRFGNDGHDRGGLSCASHFKLS